VHLPDCRNGFRLRALAGVLAAFANAAAADPAPERAAMVAFLFKLPAFVEWPDSAYTSPTDPFRLCIVGDDPFGALPEGARDAQAVGKHEIAIQREKTVSPDDHCQVMYIEGEPTFVTLSLAGRERQARPDRDGHPEWRQGHREFRRRADPRTSSGRSAGRDQKSPCGQFQASRSCSRSGRQRSVKRHLRPRFGNAFYVAAITAACFLLLFGLATVLYGTRNYDRQITQDAVIQGRILASAVSAALAFDDRKTAQGYVDSLAFNPSVEAAAIYDQTGRQFVSYARRGGNAPPSHVPRNVTSLSKDRVRIVAAVTEKGRHLGSVYLERSVEPATRRFLRFGLIAILVSMSAIILAILAISQRALASANTELARRAGELSSANAELRVQIEEREKAEAALRQSQKMEAIGQLTGGVAHDFNNLLQIITGSLGSLRRRSAKWSLPPDITGDFDRFLDGAEEGARRAAALTRQLLAFSRRQPLQPETVDVNRLVARMTSLLTRTLGETIAIETVLASGLWRVLTDPNQLESAILNLAVNARDAMPKGGKLTIETANAHLDEGYVEPYEQLSAGQYVMIAVTDSGTGMDSSTVAQAFEPFFTTKAGGHGTGLGLSQVYGFIKQSGGHTKIYSEPGQGTTIKMYLPRTLIERASAYDHAAAPETHAAAAGGETILVVEDEEKVRAASVEMLEELGYRVLEASDGPSALRLLDEKPAVDLLFTDVVLPSGMNGRQLADKIRREMPAVKVLYTTGYARNAIVHHGRLDPGVELITKPFGHAELAAKIRAVLESTPDVHNQPAGL